MQIPPAIKKEIGCVVNSVQFNSDECRAAVLAHLPKYVICELQELYTTHLRDKELLDERKAATLFRFAEKLDPLITSYAVKKAIAACIEAEKIVPSSASNPPPKTGLAKIAKTLMENTLSLSFTQVTLIASALTTLTLAGLFLFDVLTKDQLETIVKFFR